jgi:hypothetical protein
MGAIGAAFQHETLDMTKPKAYLFAFLSAGWLIPLSLSVNSYLIYLNYTIRPEITGQGFKTPFPVNERKTILPGICQTKTNDHD